MQLRFGVEWVNSDVLLGIASGPFYPKKFLDFEIAPNCALGPPLTAHFHWTI